MKKLEKYIDWFSDNSRARWIILLLVPALLYLATLSAYPLFDPDETRYSDIPSAMNRTGDYVTPRLNNVVYLEKPPLVYWVNAVFFRLLGENEFSARLFSALCAWGCIVLAYLFGCCAFSERSGIYGAGIFSTFLFTFVLGRYNILDMPVAFFISAALYCGWRFLESPRQEKPWVYTFYVALAMAFLTKGLIGVIFPPAILAIWLMLRRHYRRIAKLISPAGILIFLAVALPWVVFVSRANPEFPYFFFIHEHFLRFSTGVHSRSQPVFFFVPVIIIGIVPWLAIVIGNMDKKISAPFRDTPASSLFITWALFIFAFFSFSSSKLIPYVSPVFLPTAILMGRLFEENENEGKSQRTTMATLLLQSLIIASVFLAPLLIERESLRDMNFLYSVHWSALIIGPICLLAALPFAPTVANRFFGGRWFFPSYIMAALFLLSILIPARIVAPAQSTYELSRAVRTMVPAGQEIYIFRDSLYGLNFYGKLRTIYVDNIGELAPGKSRLSPAEQAHFFPSKEEFLKIISSASTSAAQAGRAPKDIYCVVRNGRDLVELQQASPHLHTLWSDQRFSIVRMP